MSIADAVSGYMTHKIRAAQHETWGHLGPTDGNHELTLVFTRTIYGDHVLINSKHETLEDSPWHYANMNNMVNEFLEDKQTEDGFVYQFKGNCLYSYVREHVIIDLENMFIQYDDPNESYTENSNKMLSQLKEKTGCDTALQMAEKHNLEDINDMLKEIGIEELESLSVITMTNWTGEITQLTQPF